MHSRTNYTITAPEKSRLAGKNVTWSCQDGILTLSGKGAITMTFGEFSDTVSEIRIEKGITAIPENAFSYFGKLEKVSLPKGLKSIGKEAFSICNSLKELKIPESVTKIGDDILWVGSYWVSDGSHVTYATIVAPCSSKAIEYAQKNRISYRATNHTYKTTVKKATLKKDGTKTSRCTKCGSVKSSVTIARPVIFKLKKTTYKYDGKAKKPAVIVTDAYGKKIKASNYTVKYKNNKKPGKATVTVTFKGNYKGTKKLTFRIKR